MKKNEKIDLDKENDRVLVDKGYTAEQINQIHNIDDEICKLTYQITDKLRQLIDIDDELCIASTCSAAAALIYMSPYDNKFMANAVSKMMKDAPPITDLIAKYKCSDSGSGGRKK